MVVDDRDRHAPAVLARLGVGAAGDLLRLLERDIGAVRRPVLGRGRGGENRERKPKQCLTQPHGSSSSGSGLGERDYTAVAQAFDFLG